MWVDCGRYTNPACIIGQEIHNRGDMDEHLIVRITEARVYPVKAGAINQWRRVNYNDHAFTR